MRHVLLATLLLTLVAPRARAQDDAATTIRQELTAIAEAWNAADLDRHVALYADSATMMGGRGLLRGREAIRAALERSFWKEGKPLQQLRFEEIEIRFLGSAGDAAIVTGKFILTGGDRPEASGRFSTTWERKNGRWLTVHDHSG
jgi:uncharacterized protein (TIGR02246 family)